jgi:uncharacterized membrane protein
MSQSAYSATAQNQLRRLGTLTDVVYAVALVMIIRWLPLPEESASEGAVWLIDLFAEYAANLVSVLIGLVFVILYWLRSNTLLSALDRTDALHTAFSIASVFFLLFLLYVVRVSSELVGPGRRAAESTAMAFIGISAGAAWWRARKKGLVREGISKDETVAVQIEAFAEPLAALVTLPFAYVGELAWNLAWLAYLPIAAILRRRGSRTES